LASCPVFARRVYARFIASLESRSGRHHQCHPADDSRRARAQLSPLDADFGITERVMARMELAARIAEARAGAQAAMTPAQRRAAIDAVWGPGLPTSVKLQIFDTYWNYVDERFPGFQGINDTWTELRAHYRQRCLLAAALRGGSERARPFNRYRCWPFGRNRGHAARIPPVAATGAYLGA
jgi:hypothetical protein